MGKHFAGCDLSESWGQPCECEVCTTAEKKQIAYELDRGWTGYLDLTNIEKMPENIGDKTLFQYVLQTQSLTYLQNNQHILVNIFRQYPSVINDDFIFTSTGRAFLPIEYAEHCDLNWVVKLLLNYPLLSFDESFLIKVFVNPKIKIGTICQLICHKTFSLLMRYNSSVLFECFDILNSKYLFFSSNTLRSTKCSETRRKKIINKLTLEGYWTLKKVKPHAKHNTI